MTGKVQTSPEEKKPSPLKWLIPIALFLIFMGGIIYSRGRAPFSIRELPDLAPIDQNRQLKAAPNIELLDPSGKKVALSDFRGKAVLINFWSLSCPACLIELKSLGSLSQQLSGKPFALLAVTDDPRDDIKQFLDQSGLKLPVYFDINNSAHQEYGVMYLPVSFVIDPNGDVVDQVPGAADWSDPQVITYFQKLIELSGPKKSSP